jgi:cardiolipin synthase (CMP-forming)
LTTPAAPGPAPSGRRLPWEPRYSRRDLTLANAFTAVRLILIPVFGTLWLNGEDERALVIFAVAVLTDLIDGFLARFLNQKSRLGALLDPIADKTLMTVTWIVGVSVGAAPLWLAAVIIGRDLVLGLGVLVLIVAWKDRHGPGAWRPTRIGKYAMLFQSLSIVLIIIDDTLTPTGLRPWVQSVMMVTAIMTVIAGAQYIVRAFLAVRKGSHARR